MEHLYLVHSGTKGHSGRYPYGSGEEPYQDLKRRHKIPWSQKKKEWDAKKEAARKQKAEGKEEKKNFQSTQGLIDDAAKNATKKMSNEELQAKIDRLELEKKYRTLVAEIEPKVESRGRKFAKRLGAVAGDVVVNSFKTAGQNILTDTLDFGATKALNKLTGQPVRETKLMTDLRKRREALEDRAYNEREARRKRQEQLDDREHEKEMERLKRETEREKRRRNNP